MDCYLRNGNSNGLFFPGPLILKLRTKRRGELMALSPTIQVTLMRHQTEIQQALQKSVKKVADKAIASGTTDLQSYYGQVQYHVGWVDANLTPTTNNPGKLLRSTLL